MAYKVLGELSDTVVFHAGRGALYTSTSYTAPRTNCGLLRDGPHGGVLRPRDERIFLDNL